MNTLPITTATSTNGPTQSTAADPFGLVVIELREVGLRAAAELVNIFDRLVVVVREVFPPPIDDVRRRIDEMLDDLEASAAGDDWKHARSRAALRRREAPRALVSQVTARTVSTRLATARAPRRGPGRSRRLLGKAHPLNRIEEE